jgi:hypothetical protein
MSVSSDHDANSIVEFHLPRSFAGFLYINNTPRPTMSDEVLQEATVLVDTDEEKMYLIGNMSHSWFADEIRTTGQVNFRYLEPMD